MYVNIKYVDIDSMVQQLISKVLRLRQGELPFPETGNNEFPRQSEV